MVGHRFGRAWTRSENDVLEDCSSTPVDPCEFYGLHRLTWTTSGWQGMSDGTATSTWVAYSLDIIPPVNDWTEFRKYKRLRGSIYVLCPMTSNMMIAWSNLGLSFGGNPEAYIPPIAFRINVVQKNSRDDLQAINYSARGVLEEDGKMQDTDGIMDYETLLTFRWVFPGATRPTHPLRTISNVDQTGGNVTYSGVATNVVGPWADSCPPYSNVREIDIPCDIAAWSLDGPDKPSWSLVITYDILDPSFSAYLADASLQAWISAHFKICFKGSVYYTPIYRKN